MATITGDEFNNTLYGTSGNDTIYGLGIGIYTSIKHNKNIRLHCDLTPSPFAPKGIKERIGVMVIKSSI